MGFLQKIFGKRKARNPEDDFIVTITDELVKIEHPERKTETVYWKDLKAVKLINTDVGPFLPDVWLMLIGNTSGCLIPQGAKGCEEVYNIVSKYENFNFENVIESMKCTGNQEFLLWVKK
ncbi:MAG TPA: hypothetical protein VK890_11385 [Bacteroidia bacterium]|jgi:hypothetical protein|nr:hypothetical protein [Bacteroidia bacterium]